MAGMTRIPTAAALARAIARSRTGARAAVEESLARIAAHDNALHSFVHVAGRQARRAASRADAELARGRRRGQLHGVPFALKDVFETAGMRTTAQSRLLLDHVPRRSATVARRLEDAGAILIGKLAMHEFAMGGPADELPFPTPRNPWDLTRFAGGTSSGSAVAIAAGLVPLAMGSDTGGSIRGPAGFCGVAGFKPTYGLVPRTGVIPLAFSLDTCGPMAWTVEDCALMLDAISGRDAEDPASVERPRGSFARRLRGDIAGMRIGVVRHFWERDIDADPVARDAIEAALTVLRRLGAKLTNVTLPPHADWDACCRVLIYAEANAIHEHDLATRPQDFAEITRSRFMAGAVISGSDLIHALRWRRQLCHGYARSMDGLDALVTGSTLLPAPPLAGLGDPPYLATRGKTIMAPFNVTGAPALSVCAGFTPAGLPLSIQFAGRPLEDATVLRLGHAYERATPWRASRPAL